MMMRLQGRLSVRFGNDGLVPAGETKEALLRKLNGMLSQADRGFTAQQGAFKERNGYDEYVGKETQVFMELVEANAEENMAFYQAGTRMRLIEGIIAEAQAEKITLPQLSNLVKALTFESEEVSPFRLSGLLDKYLVANGHQAQAYM